MRNKNMNGSGFQLDPKAIEELAKSDQMGQFMLAYAKDLADEWNSEGQSEDQKSYKASIWDTHKSRKFARVIPNDAQGYREKVMGGPATDFIALNGDER